MPPIKICFHNLPSAPCKVPFELGVPFKKGLIADASMVGLEIGGQAAVADVQPLQKWPDGSLKWCFMRWVQDVRDAKVVETRIVERSRESTSQEVHNKAGVTASSDGSLDFRFGACLLNANISCVTDAGHRFVGKINQPLISKQGLVATQVAGTGCFIGVDGSALSLRFNLNVLTYSSTLTSVVRFTVTNPQPSAHPNGNWDLGNAGSIYLRELNIEFPLNNLGRRGPTQVMCEAGGNSQEFSENVLLFQASSGGKNWQSSNHLDRHRQVPMPFQGYQLKSGSQSLHGLRATPCITAHGDKCSLSLGMKYFWQNFPKSIEADSHSLRLALFPKHSGYLHEIQGGEQKTHEFVIGLGAREDAHPLEWYVTNTRASLDPDYYATSEVVSHLTPCTSGGPDLYERLVALAIEGDDTFYTKREKIDQYGWRNFGDIYGDHEAVFSDQCRPLISHYNNQYDCVGAFAYQFLRSGDLRWFDQMVEMADHAWDIDTYHTDQDKSLYNGGLFWHTYHYADADTGNHRSYPKSLRQSSEMKGGKSLGELGETGKKLATAYGIGGGPSASQNYPTGWMFAYFLTGNEEYKLAAVNAAEYVIRIEDGTKTIFRWLSRCDTGHSMESSPGYYGPGRASANSLHALLTGYELTNDRKFLSAAEQIIRRVISPKDNIEALDLNNAELRWFYTMFLQSLGRYIDTKASQEDLDSMYSYAYRSLIHYASWMVENAYPTLDNPDKLQFPTETWAAQDMRKWHVLAYAAWLTSSTEASRRFKDKADFFYSYVCDTLTSTPTRTLCRPVILMLQFGWQRKWFEEIGTKPWPAPSEDLHELPKLEFTPQRAIAIRRAKSIVVAFAAFATLTLLGGAFALMRLWF